MELQTQGELQKEGRTGLESVMDLPKVAILTSDMK